MKTTVAIIPARIGSKRVPRKNIREFHGKPIIAYSIHAALETGLFDKVLVSTDSSVLASIAESYGADVPFMRPAELSGDFVGTDEVILHGINWLINSGMDVKYTCCIYATAPFLRPGDIRRGIELLKEKNAASAFSVTTYPYPIQRSLVIDSNGRLRMMWPEYRTTRSQDLPLTCHDAGQFYWVDTKKYLLEKRLFSRDAVPVIVPRHLVQDIDTEEDWKHAEIMYKSLNPVQG